MNNNRTHTTIWAALATLLLVNTISATAGALYPFITDMKAIAATASAPASSLNDLESPTGITDKERVYVNQDDGHFYTVGMDELENSADDRRIRFWGVGMQNNMLYFSDLNNDSDPDNDYDIDDVVARLKALGFNMVRLLLDGNFYASNKTRSNGTAYGEFNSLLDFRTNTQYPDLHTENANDLRLLIDKFKANGIYVTIPLRGFYQFDRFSPADCYTKSGKADQCVPDPDTVTTTYPTTQGMPNSSRPLDHFNPQMIELQKWYFEELLNHPHPVTGLKLKDDPGLALLEINNESSLIDFYRYSETGFNDNFPPLYAEEFDTLWNTWLNAKYTSSGALKSAWAENPNRVRNGEFDDLTTLSYPDYSVHTGSHADPGCTVSNASGAWATGSLIEPGSDGNKKIELTLIEKPCENRPYVLDLRQNDLLIQADTAYSITFSVSTISPLATDLRVSIIYQDGSGQTQTILSNQTITLDPANAETTFSFDFVSSVSTSNALLIFTPFIAPDSDAAALEAAAAKVIIDGISLVETTTLDGRELVRNGDFDAISSVQYPDYTVHTGSHADEGCTVTNGTGAWATGAIIDRLNNGDHEIELTLTEKPCENRQYVLDLRQVSLGTDPTMTDLAAVGIEENTAYEVTFTASTDSPLATDLSVSIGYQDSNNQSQTIMAGQSVTLEPNSVEITQSFCFYSSVSVTNALLQFVPFIAPDSDAAALQAAPAKIYIDDISIMTATPENLVLGEGLSTGDSLVSRPHRDFSSRCPPVAQWESDYLQFIIDTEAQYFQTMEDYLKIDLQVNQPVTGTQGNYGGLANNQIIANQLDYVDTHFYWENHSNVAYSGGNFFSIPNTPMTEQPGESALLRFASTKVEGMPYVISEYGMPTGNQYTQESPLMIGALAALHDVDGIFMFNYHTLGSGYDPRNSIDRDVNTAYLLGRHTTLSEARRETQMHLAANIFRRADVNAARDVLKLHIDNDMVKQQAALSNPSNIRSIEKWLQDSQSFSGLNNNPFDARIGLEKQIELVYDNASQEAFAIPGTLHVSNPANDPAFGEIKWSESGASSYLAIDTQHTRGITGYLDTVSAIETGVNITGIGGSGQFGSVTLTSMDGAPLATSATILVTSIGTTKNSAFSLESRPDGSSDGSALCNTIPPAVVPSCDISVWEPGTGPVLVEYNAANIIVAGAATTISVENLNADGTIATSITVPVNNEVGGRYGIDIGLAGDASPWYLLSANIAAPETVEAENAQTVIPPSNGTYGNANASNGAYVELDVNGYLEVDVPAALPAGDYYVELTLRGMEFNGAPELNIERLSDNQLVGSLRVTAALGDSWQRLLASEQPINLNNPNETLKIEFINDAVGAFGLNRRVHIDKIDFYRAHKAPHANLDTDGDGLVDSTEVCFDGDCSSYNPYHPIDNPSGSDLDANEPDSDGDGSNDSIEITQGTDPLNAQSTPVTSAVAAPGFTRTSILLLMLALFWIGYRKVKEI